jgi:hypothetical protein
MKFSQFLKEAPREYVPAECYRVWTEMSDQFASMDYPELDWMIDYFASKVVSNTIQIKYNRLKSKPLNPRQKMKFIVRQMMAQDDNSEMKMLRADFIDISTLLDSDVFKVEEDGKVFYSDTLDMNDFGNKFQPPPFKFGYLRTGIFYKNSYKDNSILACKDWFPDSATLLDIMQFIENISGIHTVLKECEKLRLTGEKLDGGILGLLKIKGLKKVGSGYEAIAIINKYLPNNDGNQAIMKCQTELIQAGFREHAKL